MLGAICVCVVKYCSNYFAQATYCLNAKTVQHLQYMMILLYSIKLIRMNENKRHRGGELKQRNRDNKDEIAQTNSFVNLF